MVVNITELPYKCPVAPLEFIFLADAYFKKKGMRDKVEISLVTPLPGVFTKPIATKMLSKVVEEKNIKVIPDYNISEVDNVNKKIIDYAGTEVEFDVLVTIPTNKGDDMIERSGMGDDLNFVPTDKFTLQAVGHPNIFVIGDTASVQNADGTPVPGLAPAAIQQGSYAARQILARLRGEQSAGPFVYKNYGTMATIGRGMAIADFGKFSCAGFLAWCLWGAIHLMPLVGFRNRFVVACDWLWSYFTHERGVRLITVSGRGGGEL